MSQIKQITEKELDDYDRTGLKTLLNQIIIKKSEMVKFNQLQKPARDRNQKKMVEELIKKDPNQYSAYKFLSKDDYKKLDNEQIKKAIIELQKKPPLDKENIDLGIVGIAMPKKAKNKTKMQKDVENTIEQISDVSVKTPDTKNIEELGTKIDFLREVDKSKPSDELKQIIKESSEITLNKIVELSKTAKSDQAKEQLDILFKKINDKIPKVEVQALQFLDNIEELESIQQENKKFQSDMTSYQKRKQQREMSKLLTEEELETTYMSPKQKMIQQQRMDKLLGNLKEEEKEEMEQKEEPFIPKPVVGTDYQGSKEMYVKPEQKPLEPFGGLQSEQEINAPYLSTTSDKAIGDVRQVGFIGAQDQLAKVDDVTLEPSERSKSLKRFTNFRWVQSVQNSDLGYASPFQRMDDIDDRRRYGKCFMHVNKMPKDPDTQEELEKAKGFNTYSLVPSFDMSSRMQPAGNLSFINSTSKFARKITGNEQGMEPINQGKRNVSNLKNTLEFPTLLFSEDPLKKIKDKYKNNIVC
jgi:hypothetical protein